MSNRRLSKCLDVEDVRALARSRAHKAVFDYIDGAADDEVTLRHNQSVFRQWSILHRVLVGVDDVDCSTRIFGRELSYPFICGPAAGNRLFHTQGELAVARSAAEFGVPYCLSTLASVSIEKIAAVNKGEKWFQLYVWKDRGRVREMLQRAKESGFTALILTADFAVAGNRQRDPRNGFTIPPKMTLKQILHAVRAPAWTWDYLFGEGIRYANLDLETPAATLSDFVAEQLSAEFNWQDAEWLLSEWSGNSVLKGLVHPDDALAAKRAGFDALMVSNHGGRQLDHAAPPLLMLEEIVEQVGAQMPVILDGGVRRGTDMLKALALGACAVSFARPYLYGLAAAGELGVRKVLSILATELERDFALAGVSRVQALQRDCLRPVHRSPEF